LEGYDEVEYFHLRRISLLISKPLLLVAHSQRQVIRVLPKLILRQVFEDHGKWPTRLRVYLHQGIQVVVTAAFEELPGLLGAWLQSQGYREA